ncbi:hypothetical protein APA58_33925 [Pseudomonas aeruginosa]|nr:hypothetical protein APA58_33925 [Pseudomonas aeruginosa]
MGTTDLNGGALFNAEFGIRHRGSTVPERSGVALSFCRRPPYPLRSVSVGWPDATLMLITGQCPQGMRLDYKSFIRSRVEPGGLGTMHCRQWVSLLLTSAFG